MAMEVTLFCLYKATARGCAQTYSSGTNLCGRGEVKSISDDCEQNICSVKQKKTNKCDESDSKHRFQACVCMSAYFTSSN